MKNLVLSASLALPVLARCQSETTCPMHNQTAMTDGHAAGVDARGDHAMGFFHQASAHHFLLYPNGGAIEVDADNKEDQMTRDEIRVHLSHIAQMFTDGDFQVPMFIHDIVPPGVSVMKSKRSAITYTFKPTPTGGRVCIATADKDALKAIHAFLVFQIDDHRTGDSKLIDSLQ